MNTMAFISPFINDPFALVCQAYKNLYDKPFVAQYGQRNKKAHEEGYGYTNFVDGETPLITIFAESSVNVCLETFAHELAHVAVGVEHEHDGVWETAFESIFQEYNRLCKDIFGVDDSRQEDGGNSE